MGLRPEGQRLGDEPLTGRRELDDAYPAVSRNAAELDQPHGGERPEVPGEGRRVHREHGGDASHHGARLAAHRDGVEQRELGCLDAERAKRVIVEAGNDAGGAAGAKAEAVRGHCRGGAAVGFHERCIYKGIGGGKGRAPGAWIARAP
jgi:hypothetical protein